MKKPQRLNLTMLLLPFWVACISPVWAETDTSLTERQEVEQQIKRIEEKLKTEPKLEGWILLGGAYLHLERFREAVGAYQNAYLISGYDEEVRSKLEYALYRAGLANESDQKSTQE